MGHSMRIGSLLWYILNGMPFAEAMAKGRWTTPESFHLYLRQHMQTLAPHLESNEGLYHELHECACNVRVTGCWATEPSES